MRSTSRAIQFKTGKWNTWPGEACIASKATEVVFQKREGSCSAGVLGH